jgi:hypothetical protein
MKAGASGYTYLSVSGIVDLGGGTSVDVAPLSLEFKSWPFGSLTGNVKHYGPPSYASAAEYTYFATGTDPSEGGTTYFNPIKSGFACAKRARTVVNHAGCRGIRRGSGLCPIPSPQGKASELRRARMKFWSDSAEQHRS